MFLFAGLDDGAVGQDDLGRDQVVAGQAVAAGEVADAPAQSQPGDPGRADDAAGRRQAEGAGGLVEDLPRAATAGPHRAIIPVDHHVLHQVEVDHDAAVIGPESRGTVAASPDRHVDAFFPDDRQDTNHVCGVETPHHRSGAPVDHAVVDPAGVVVVGMGGANDLPFCCLAKLVVD